MRLIDADVLIKHLCEIMTTANHFGYIERVSEIGACIGVIKGEKTIENRAEYVCSVIDQLLQDIESTGTTYTVDGDTITTDVGYADEGIDFFVKHLKQRLKGKQDDG